MKGKFPIKTIASTSRYALISFPLCKIKAAKLAASNCQISVYHRTIKNDIKLSLGKEIDFGKTSKFQLLVMYMCSDISRIRPMEVPSRKMGALT